MSTNSELIAEQLMGALEVQRIWGGIVVNVLEYGFSATDATSAIIKAINVATSVGGTLVFPPMTYTTKSSITFPSNVSVMFIPGAQIAAASGTKLTFLGPIFAPNQEIFLDYGATIDLDNSPNEYNLCWFHSGSGYINERWEFAKRGMLTFRTKLIRIPRPFEGQDGSYKSGNRLYWYFSDEIKITDNQNASTWYIDAEFYAKNNCTNFINIEDSAKPENIYFYGALQALVPAGTTVLNGINMKSGSRITFYGNPVLNGFQTSIKLGGTDQVAAVTNIRFIELQSSFFSNTGVLIYGKSPHTVQNIIFDNLNCTAAQVAGLNAIEIKGLIRDVKIGNAYYATDVAKDGYTAFDAENVVYIESNAEGAIYHVEISAVYQANANNGVKTRSANSDYTRITGLVVRRVYGKFNGNGVDLDYCFNTRVYDIENSSAAVIGTNAYYTGIVTGQQMKTLTDNGNYTTINGLGKQSRGAGVLPAANIDWPIGSLIRESSDGKVYLRYAKTGVAANDFVVLN